MNHEKFLGKGPADDTPIAWPARRTDTPALPLVLNFFMEPKTAFHKYTTDPALEANVHVTVGPHGDIPIGLTCTWGHEEADFLQPPPPKAPGHAVAYFNEHGVAEAHKGFVADFLAAMGDDLVHAFGHLKNRELPESMAGKPFRLQDRLDVVGGYKFHLVTEFVEEAGWVEGDLSQTYMAGSVPIYIGAPDVADYVPGENSMVHARDFVDAAALAEHVKALLADEERYAAMFAWKQRGLAPRFREHLSECVYLAEERICDRVLSELDGLKAAEA